jgi:hypothetical protein
MCGTLGLIQIAVLFIAQYRVAGPRPVVKLNDILTYIIDILFRAQDGGFDCPNIFPALGIDRLTELISDNDVDKEVIQGAGGGISGSCDIVVGYRSVLDTVGQEFNFVYSNTNSQ